MKRKERWLAGLSFAAFLLGSVFFIFCLENGKRADLRERTGYVTSSQVSRLQYVMDTLLLKTQTLEMLVVEGGGRIEHFDQIAEALCDNEAIRSLQLAPDGVVTQIYPLKGNENGFVDLFDDPARATEAVMARDSGEMTLSGPFELYQGGTGVVARRPVYLEGEGGEKKFWGFTIIVLNMPDALTPAGLDHFIKAGFDYKLYRIHPDTGKPQVIDESSAAELSDPVKTSFQVPNAEWYFSVMPIGGWTDKKTVAGELILAVVFSALLALIVVFIRGLGHQKKKFYQLAMTDHLTGLHNFCYFEEYVTRIEKRGQDFFLFYMDLDGFKQINDTFGHFVGNEILIETAGRLKKCFGEDGEVFRNGGDEFSAVVPGARPLSFGQELSAAVKQAFSAPFQTGAGLVSCGISIGFAAFPSEGSAAEKIIQKADTRMYEMKGKLKKAGSP